MNLRDGVDKTFLNTNIYKIRSYTERLNNKNYKDIFLGFREGKYTFYYYGYTLLDFKIIDDKVVIITRDKFNNNELLNQEYRDFMSKIPLTNGVGEILATFKAEENKDNFIIYEENYCGYSKKYLMEYLLDHLKELLNKRFNCKENGERCIQNKYTTKYFLNDDIYIVDMELILPRILKVKLKEQNIEGRYDMVALHKENNIYKLVFIELKSNKGACKGKSGVNKHIYDMTKFLNEYNTGGELKKVISEFVKNTLDSKKILKLINFTELKYDFDNPEFWLLFDMQDKTDCSSINNIEKIIGAPLLNKDKDYIKIYIGNIDKKELTCLEK